jgi:hypothetical protein
MAVRSILNPADPGARGRLWVIVGQTWVQVRGDRLGAAVAIANSTFNLYALGVRVIWALSVHGGEFGSL